MEVRRSLQKQQLLAMLQAQQARQLESQAVLSSGASSSSLAVVNDGFGIEVSRSRSGSVHSRAGSAYSDAGDERDHDYDPEDDHSSYSPNGMGSPGSPYSTASFASGRLSSLSKHRDADEINKNFKVVIRVRPPLPRELEGDKPFVNVARVDPSQRVITLAENLSHEGQEGYDGVYATHVFTFDYVYDQMSMQKEVYDSTAKSAVLSTLQGYNATIIAYGQTGTGKTYTMEGFTSDEQRGIIPRATEEIFNYIQNCVNPKTKFLVRASYLQIYNEVISDLLKPERKNLMIREDKKKGVFVEGLSEWVVRSPAEIYGLMERGASVRATGATRMNELSSRSHAVFIIIAEQSETVVVGEEPSEEAVDDAKKRGELRQSFKIGKLNLVDLAGSERVRHTGATGVRLEESKKINQSLSALGNVIAALTDPRGRQHIPYRDSKLTRILEDSLGGNCKTTMMAMISPALEAFAESLSTLKFANRAKNIKNEAHVNEDLDQRALLRKYERELRKLRAELEEKNKNVVDKRKLLELEEQKRRAEEDKLAAIKALELRSREFMLEKEEKRKLEERIQSMQSQLLVGGQKIEDTPQFRNALQQEYQRVHREYADKLAEIERERQCIEEDKAQVDRYKQLLLKQRDIMIALTARLNERDESILALQEELDAYDRHQRMMEDALDQKTASLIHLQRVTMEMSASSPVKNPLLVEALGDWNVSNNSFSSAMGDAMAPGASHEDARERKWKPYAEQTLFGSQGPSGHEEPHAAEHGSMLTADEKISELSLLLDSKQAEQTKLAAEFEEVQAEKVSLEYLLREKLEKMVQAEIEDRINQYRREIEQFKAESALHEEKRRFAEYMLEMHKLNADSSEFHTRVADVIQRESEAIRKPFMERISKLQVELEESRSAREQLKHEMEQLRASDPDRPSAGASSSEVDRLWKRVQQAEEETKQLKAKLQLIGKLKSGKEDASAAAAAAVADAAAGEDRIKQLEGRVESLKWQHSQFRTEVTTRLEEKNAQIKEYEEEIHRLRNAPSSSSAASRQAAGASSAELSALRQQVEKLREENGSLAKTWEDKLNAALKERKVEETLWRAERQNQLRELFTLKQQATNNGKERQALKTILEAKIKVMVDTLSSELLPLEQPKLTREISSLQKLVNASIVALKSSEAQQQAQAQQQQQSQQHHVDVQ